MTATVCIINGPNLNLLGSREPEIYGSMSLADIEARCRAAGDAHGIDIAFFQSNHEGDLVDRIQQAIDDADGIVINAAACTHTSIAIHDALRAFPGPKIELHLSNPHLREPFRRVSYVAPAVDAVIAGLGATGYELAVSYIAKALARRNAAGAD